MQLQPRKPSSSKQPRSRLGPVRCLIRFCLLLCPHASSCFRFTLLNQSHSPGHVHGHMPPRSGPANLHLHISRTLLPSYPPWVLSCLVGPHTPTKPTFPWPRATPSDATFLPRPRASPVLCSQAELRSQSYLHTGQVLETPS